jgi:hypothetical protein
MLCVETWTSSSRPTFGSSLEDAMQASNVATTSIYDNDSIEKQGQELRLKTHMVPGAIFTTYLGRYILTFTCNYVSSKPTSFK